MDKKREKYIRNLCKQVLNMIPDHCDVSEVSTCHFCSCKDFNGDKDMIKIEHKGNCAYLIAKDLYTNYGR